MGHPMVGIGLLPTERHAARDRRLKPIDVRVMLILPDILDLVEFRAVKSLEIEAAIDISPAQVSRALGRLVRCGYLERGRRAWTRGPYTFRLRLSPVKHQTAA